MNYIELFAGCGGLSLGVESLGFDLLFANELSPMASETFAYNLLNEDLSAIPDGSRSAMVKWITSDYPATNLAKRLRENPHHYPEFTKDKSDLKPNLTELEGRLLVGSIVDLNKFLRTSPRLTSSLRRRNVDLVSGGPPCQSFSLAGLRQVDNQRNTLPMDFAEFVQIVEPKIALLENVSGILRAFKLDSGRHYAWFEVARAFASMSYYPLCLHVNAKYVGAAQNRPRFILIAMRKDVFTKVRRANKSVALSEALDRANSFVDREISGTAMAPFQDLDYYDIERDADFFAQPLFSSLTTNREEDSIFTVEDAIDDLVTSGQSTSGYLSLLKATFPYTERSARSNQLANHEHRENNVRVRMRFMLYQHLSDLRSAPNNGGGARIERDVLTFLKNPDSHALTNDSAGFLLSRKYLAEDGESLLAFSSKKQLSNYLQRLATKKQTQRALIRTKPAPAALSIPDDACHYDKHLQRTLTVREMARFQSFPDWFEFRSKTTTGGQMRKFEVPQYTQVGNAVPPLLGRALGEVVLKLLNLKG